MSETQNKDYEALPFSTADFSPKQIEFIVKLSEIPPTFKNITDFCEQVGISRPTYYSWIEMPEIREAREKLLMATMKNNNYIAMAGLMKGCAKGDSKSLRLYLEYIQGWVPKKEMKVDGPGLMLPTQAIVVVAGEEDGDVENPDTEVVEPQKAENVENSKDANAGGIKDVENSGAADDDLAALG